MPNAPKKPRMIVLPSKAGAGKHNVWVQWPDGEEQQVDTGQPSGAFDSEAEAKSWIENESEAWLKKHPKNRQRQ
jgi:hypothetical protein